MSHKSALRQFAIFVVAGLSSLLAFGFGKAPFTPGNPTMAIEALRMEGSVFSPAEEQDRDRDCMNDGAEHALAMQYRPYFVFDSQENARRTFEPVVLYRVKTGLSRAHGCTVAPASVEIIYAHLYQMDGGYAKSLLCDNRHAGDNQAIPVTVGLTPTTDGALEARPTRIGLWADLTWPDHRVTMHLKKHPTFFLSAGKHHQYTDTSWNKKGFENPSWGCREAVDGLGHRVLAELESPYMPRGRHNVGEPDAHSPQYFVNDLLVLGFPEEDAWGKTGFCGGLPGTKLCKPGATASMRGVWGN